MRARCASPRERTCAGRLRHVRLCHEPTYAVQKMQPIRSSRRRGRAAAKNHISLEQHQPDNANDGLIQFHRSKQSEQLSLEMATSSKPELISLDKGDFYPSRTCKFVQPPLGGIVIETHKLDPVADITAPITVGSPD